jgi:hypothetical protein
VEDDDLSKIFLALIESRNTEKTSGPFGEDESKYCLLIGFEMDNDVCI